MQDGKNELGRNLRKKEPYSTCMQVNVWRTSLRLHCISCALNEFAFQCMWDHWNSLYKGKPLGARGSRRPFILVFLFSVLSLHRCVLEYLRTLSNESNRSLELILEGSFSQGPKSLFKIFADNKLYTITTSVRKLIVNYKVLNTY